MARRAISGPDELLVHLRAGDRLMHTHPGGWRLIRLNSRVAKRAVDILKGPNRHGGRLQPMGDGLLVPNEDSQTWSWLE
jgi:hypothetical protein